MRTCKKCGQDKPLDQFYRYRSSATGKEYTRHTCSTCIKEYNETYGKSIASNKKVDYHLRNTYGITLVEYEALLDEQEYRCAICGVDEEHAPTRKNYRNDQLRLHVDHDHETSKVRGLLCLQCNQGLGQFKDNVDTLRAALKYLESNG